MKFRDMLSESSISDKFAKEIDKAINKVDDEMLIKDFALGVAKILENNYGSHNYAEFFKVLKQNI